MRPQWGALVILIAAFYAGWMVRGWHDAELKLAASASAEKTRRFFAELTRQSGEVLEAKLRELKANEIHMEKVIHTETIKPVFSNVCATDEYVRLFNESAGQAERTLSGKSISPLHGNATPPDGKNR